MYYHPQVSAPLNQEAETAIRATAIEILRCLQEVEPLLFGDYEIMLHGDDTYIARGKYQKV